VQQHYGIDGAYVKHHILQQDYGRQAPAAESAGEEEKEEEAGKKKKKKKKNTSEARWSVQNPHPTAAEKRLAVGYQLLLQHLLTLQAEVSLHAMPMVAKTSNCTNN
jgi:hypothetical protein